jgi:methionyl-tRNA synthetase
MDSSQKTDKRSVNPEGVQSIDAVRYYLLRAVSPCEDGDFSSERLVLLYNSDLANNLGNLLSRVTTLCEKGNYGSFKSSEIPHAPGGYHEALSSYEFDKALKFLWAVVSQINQDIDRVQPWKALKAGNLLLLRNQLTRWLDEVHRVAYWLTPFLPDTGKKIVDILSAVPITASVPLFPRLTEGRGVK